MTARVLDVSPEEYFRLLHFSASAAKRLALGESPRRVRSAVGKSPTKAMEFGDVCHALVLGKGKQFEVIRADDWRKKTTQDARDSARAAGKVPILDGEFEDACLLSETVRVALAESGILLDGRSECVIEWTEQSRSGPVPCKGMLDHVLFDAGVILDLKFVGDARLSFVERQAENLGYGIQRAAYTRALTQLRPEHAGRVRFLFCLAETSDPPEVREIKVVSPDGVFCELGEQRWLRGVEQWGKCLADDHWPGLDYTTISAPLWALRQEGFTSDE